MLNESILINASIPYTELYAHTTWSGMQYIPIESCVKYTSDLKQQIIAFGITIVLMSLLILVLLWRIRKKEGKIPS